MLDPELLVYYKHREAKERELAAAASSPDIRKIHRELADSYARIIQAAERPPERSAGSPMPSRASRSSAPASRSS